jgi:hypothetical protein
MQANKKELFHVSGDQHNGAAQGATGMNLNNSALCHPVVYYPKKGIFLTLDVFDMPGTPRYVVVRCPVCQARNPNAEGMDLTIKEDQKEMSIDAKALPKIDGFTTSELVQGLGLQHPDELRGRISIEPFGCTWEAEPELRRSFGFSCCEWNVAIKNNIMVDVPR